MQFKVATPRSQIGRCETLTRLANDSDGLVATTWVTIGASSSPRSNVKFDLSPDWVLESVQSTERRYSTVLQRISRSENAGSEIQIAPALENQALTLEFRCRNNSITKPEGSSSSTLTFDGDRPITVRDLKQSDIYWIEPTGRYTIEANPGLLQCQIDAHQISENQRQRLPRIGEVWLIKPEGSKIPSLTFRRQAAPYTAVLETTIEPSLRGVSANYRVKCAPLAGAVSSVTIDLDVIDHASIRWRQLICDNESEPQWIFVDSQSVRREDPKSKKKIVRPKAIYSHRSSSSDVGRIRIGRLCGIPISER